MSESLRTEVMRRIDRDHPRYQERNGKLQRLVCPSCRKEEAWAHAANPWVLICGRLERCGEKSHVKELYPELFEQWSDRYVATETNPHAAADAYLAFARGFDVQRIAGWYTQGDFYKPELDAGSVTVRFELPSCGASWERIIDRPQRFGKQKANFRGQYKGHWWAAPGVDLVHAREIWITEGCFDSIALMHHDLASAAALSCNNYPADALAALAQACADAEVERPTLVWALDAGRAGERYTREWVKRSRDQGWTATAAQPPAGRRKQDWNDLHQQERLGARDLETYRYYGELLIADSPLAKALVMYRHSGQKQYWFDFNNRLWWWSLDLDQFTELMHDANLADDADDEAKAHARDEALKQAGAIKEIANCLPQALYYQQNSITDESWYFFRVTLPDGLAIKNTFSASQLASAAEFDKRLLGMAPGAMFDGSTRQLKLILKRQLEGIRTVQTIDFIGYSREHGIYVLGDIAIQAGKLIPLNDEDFFEGKGLAIKSLNRSGGLKLNPDLHALDRRWPQVLWQVYGAQGFVALAFWFGSLFAEQIRAEQQSFPFLEIIGEAGSGKTSLIEFMWKLVGRPDYEGFDPLKSSGAGLYRNLEQFANLPVSLIEGDREASDTQTGRPAKSFEWDSLKTAYNGRSIRARGLKNSGNETYEPPFRGSLVITQNAEVNASEAILTRICQIRKDRGNHRPELRPLADQLAQLDVEVLSGFAVASMLKEAEVLAHFRECQPAYERELRDMSELRSIRIQKNHAQLMALVDCLALVIELPEAARTEAQAELVRMAVARQQRINADHKVVAAFWELYDFLEADLEDDIAVLNHSRDRSLIAINLNQFEQVCAERKLSLPALQDLKDHLRTSRAHKFIDIKSVNSAINAAYNARRDAHWAPRPSTVKCWVFQK
ncbi:toprim domain-containing protein [Chitiniphilus eburneus]|uniref:toprim domain-containing protein n=1 Tax=Chitiniphilus eburneus TaxID=2571148 RepID=UPI0035D00078